MGSKSAVRRGYQAKMITAIIATRDDEEALAHALAALAPAAMEGIVRDAIVVDAGSRDGTLAVADEAGCTVVEGSGAEALMRAADMARGDWLLFLSPASVLESGWQGEALAFVDRAFMAGNAQSPRGDLPAPPRRGRGTGAARRGTRRHSARGSSRRAYGEQGLLISRGFYRALGGHRDLAAMADVDLARRIGRRRLTLLRARAMVRRPDDSGSGLLRSARNAACLALFVLRLPPRLIGRLAG